MTTTTIIKSVNPPIGIMHPSYFVGKVELLNWLNDLLELRLTKVEQTCSGAVAIQVFDNLFPDAQIPMGRVNWSDLEYHYVSNYKILQNAAAAVSCDRYIDVQKLVKGKYQDNLEFLQWLKAFFDHNQHHGVYQYDAKARRAMGKTAGSPAWVNLSSSGATKKTTTEATTTRKATTTTTTILQNQGKENTSSSSSLSPASVQNDSFQSTRPSENKNNKATAAALLETVRGERDEYFKKLRDIETLLESTTFPDDSPARDLVESLFSILYGGNNNDNLD